jgi:hypothetical protein
LHCSLHCLFRLHCPDGLDLFCHQYPYRYSSVLVFV